MGLAVLSLSREAANDRYVVDLSIQGGMVAQHYDVLFNATTLMPVSQLATMTIQGATLNTRVSIANGRATGTAQDPGPTGIVSSNVNLAVPPGTVDDQVLGALVLTLPLAEGYKTTFTSLGLMPAEVRTNEVSVLGKETVTVPAGTFETYRVLVHSRDDATMFVTTASPHRIVLVRVSSGVELRLIK